MPVSISRKELIRKFRALGYVGPFSGGKHQFMVKDRHKIRIPNPHGGKDIQ
jgi:predicted RNA binding protein YcfA (HicA-like mRNA interferase family)